MNKKYMVIGVILSSISLGCFSQEVSEVKVKPSLVEKVNEEIPKVFDAVPPKPIEVAAPTALPDNSVVVKEPEVNAKTTEVGIDEKTKQETEVLRNIFSVFTKAINTNDIEKLKSVTRDGFMLVSSEQVLTTGKTKVEEYFPKEIGSDYRFTRVDMSIDPGAVIEVSTDKNWVTAYGKGVEKYSMNGINYDLPIRWTANLIKENEVWKIHSFHSGVNFSENSVMKGLEDFSWKLGSVGAIVGMLLGFLIGLIVGGLSRAKKQKI